jgi:hypothetical protein
MTKLGDRHIISSPSQIRLLKNEDFKKRILILLFFCDIKII